MLLLKGRQKCIGKVPIERFFSAVASYPKLFPCLGDSDHPWLSSPSGRYQNLGMQLELVAPALGKVNCWPGYQEHLKRLVDFSFLPCCSLKQDSLTDLSGPGPWCRREVWVGVLRGQHGTGVLWGETSSWGCGRGAVGDSVASQGVCGGTGQPAAGWL